MRFQLLVAFMMCLSFASLSAQNQDGLASVRPLAHEGILTNSGERFSHDSLVASHRSIPFGSLVKITNLRSRETIQVKINDRGPFIKGHIIDLSEVAADSISLSHDQVTEVRLQIIKIENNLILNNSNSYNNPGEIFGIQIASYSEIDNAINYKNQMLKKYNLNKKLKIKPENLNGEILYKIYLGSFKTRLEAEEYKTYLPKGLQNGYVTLIK